MTALRIPWRAWLSPLQTVVKAWSVLFSDGMALSGRPDLLPLDLDRDFPDIERQFAIEQWPFVRADLEISHAQPQAVAFVARKDGRFAGFYAAHHFGTLGYLDMSIISADFRGQGIVRPLHARIVRELRARGIRALAVHTTNDSAPLIWILGFSRGQTFTLLARDPSGATPTPVVGPFTRLGPADRDELLALDAEVFGLRREEWTGGLLAQPSTRFYGHRRDGRLVASIAVRTRQAGAVCLDAANARSFADLEPLVDAVLAAEADHRVECFARDGRDLDRALRARGFAVPDFFVAIGPLVEWRKGRTGSIGDTPFVQCLSWF